MNCLDARRQMLQDPRLVTPALQMHLDTCVSCYSEQNNLVSFETDLHDAIKSEAPSSLKQAILSDIRTDYKQQKRKQFSYIGIAASVLIAASVWINVQTGKLTPIASAVISHIEDERQHLRQIDSVSNEDINRLLSSMQGKYQGESLKVNYAGRCQMRSSQGLHLVLQGDQGAVTVLLMPGEHPKAQSNLTTERFQGSIYPTPYGSFAVVGEHGEDTSAIAKKFNQSLTIAL